MKKSIVILSIAILLFTACKKGQNPELLSISQPRPRVTIIYEVKSMTINDTLQGSIDNFYLPDGHEVQMNVGNTSHFQILTTIEKPSVGDTLRMYGSFINSHYLTTMYVGNEFLIISQHHHSGNFYMEYIIKHED